VTANEAPMLFVWRIKNELLELPISKIAITNRYFQYPTGNSRKLGRIHVKQANRWVHAHSDRAAC
jgi:hypothetical protein